MVVVVGSRVAVLGEASREEEGDEEEEVMEMVESDVMEVDRETQEGSCGGGGGGGGGSLVSSLGKGLRFRMWGLAVGIRVRLAIAQTA